MKILYMFIGCVIIIPSLLSCDSKIKEEYYGETIFLEDKNPSYYINKGASSINIKNDGTLLVKFIDTKGAQFNSSVD